MTVTSAPAPRPAARIPVPEFIALIAMLFATVAFSIDAMLPALPEIAAELTPDLPNRAQLIVTSFVLGMGIGTFLAGPLSDAWGRRPVILGGTLIYCAGAVAAWAGDSLELVLLARVVQGLGAAGPRIVTMAMVRDLYAGRQMARIVSFAMMIFTLVPAIAPAIGVLIIANGGWRGIFVAFVLFSLAAALWFGLRQPETLAPAVRIPLQGRALLDAAREVLAHRVVRISMLAQSLVFAALFGTLSSIQQVFDQSFDRASTFPAWFAMIALVAGVASLVNAALVVRLGMRRMVTTTLIFQIGLSGAMTVVSYGGLLPDALLFPAFLFWATGVFFMVGLTVGNLNALAFEPMGHIAGMAASVTLSLATVGAVVLAVPVGLAFDGTPAPLALGVTLMAIGALLLMDRLPR